MNCPVGSYYKAGICQLCPVNTYQDKEAQVRFFIYKNNISENISRFWWSFLKKMTSYWLTIGQLKCIQACHWSLVFVFAYYWSFVFHDVIFYYKQLRCNNFVYFITILLNFDFNIFLAWVQVLSRRNLY